ncbi:protein of unknown function DUF220, partial [Dillenia turbinata]
AIMGEIKVNDASIDASKNANNRYGNTSGLSFPTMFVQVPHKVQDFLKSHIKRLGERNKDINPVNISLKKEKTLPVSLETNLEKQVELWRENPVWTDQTPEIKVSVPKGSLCNLSVDVQVGLPPDAVYNIVTDPDNKRVFKNIKEVVSRKVLVDEGSRQLVELEQAAWWRFLWWSGTIAVHVLVDQNRENHTMKFKQLKTGFMKRFEGCWRVEPIFVDEKYCFPFKPKTWDDYCSCTGGKGRIGSRVTLEQLIQPAILPPPPISWYLRGITSRTTEMLINDLLAETARVRGDTGINRSIRDCETSQGALVECRIDEISDIKERWAIRRRNARQCRKRLPWALKSDT